MSENKSVINVSLFVLLCAVFSYFYLDKSIAIFFHHFDISTNHAWIISLFHDITKIGESQYSLIILFSLFIIFRKRIPLFAHEMLYLFSAVALSGIIVDILKIVFGRFRPTMLFEHDLYGFIGFKMGTVFNSLPSGHSATAFALAIGLTLLFPKYKYIYLFIAVLIASSRVILTFHYLSDVLIGSLLGGLISFLFYQKYFYSMLTSKDSISISEHNIGISR